MSMQLAPLVTVYTCADEECPVHGAQRAWHGTPADEPTTRCPVCYGAGVPAEPDDGSAGTAPR